jgi:signal-transduction protein with cAMP-binding, CBS, and nucleotidyltransferase domain
MPSVSDLLLGRELYQVQQDETVACVARRMAEWSVGAVPVFRGEHLLGVFSERDLMKRVVLERRDPESTLVGTVMTPDPATIDECATPEAAMEAMSAQGCRHLPVTHGSRVVGFLSMRDLMYWELASKTDELTYIKGYIQRA